MRKTWKFFEKALLHKDKKDCLIWPYGKSKGYARIWKNNKNQYVSRLICEEILGSAPSDKPWALHSCGKGHTGCINPYHLYWGNRNQNAQDAIKDGAQVKGEHQWMAKLNQNDIKEIRELRGKLFQKEIAKIYGVKTSQISKIQLKQCWKD